MKNKGSGFWSHRRQVWCKSLSVALTCVNKSGKIYTGISLAKNFTETHTEKTRFWNRWTQEYYIICCKTSQTHYYNSVKVRVIKFLKIDIYFMRSFGQTKPVSNCKATWKSKTVFIRSTKSPTDYSNVVKPAKRYSLGWNRQWRCSSSSVLW